MTGLEKAARQALDTLVEMNPSGPTGSDIWHKQMEAITALRRALEQQPAAHEAVQVSPLEFVTMVMEKEHLVGKPLFWAEWPNKESGGKA